MGILKILVLSGLFHSFLYASPHSLFGVGINRVSAMFCVPILAMIGFVMLLIKFYFAKPS